ncbi:hypothetical protein L6164_022603 [Bauhinia variegata]|uniref:Uncharacterized protein n=1 Tax=Bauhinia variegata TaxID=167791 RepID=A0ACB9MG55_BAUVA|nr:hypothetical protein L6164_022603 [Bauhinia variegata]
MASHGTVTPSTPLLEARGDGHGGQVTRGGGWWNKVLDMVEVKIQLHIAVPMVLTNLFYYLIPLVAVMFAGHLGEVQLAGSSLGNSWNVVTGQGIAVGLSGALETLCGQAFGSGDYRMLGVYMQSGCIISFLFCIVISVIWFFTEPILIFLHQSHSTAKATAVYMKYLIPGIFAYAFMQNLLRFLQTQSIVAPLIILSGLPLLIHIGVTYALVDCTILGYKGAPLAVSITLWISMIALALYVLFSKKFKKTWTGLSSQAFNYLLTDLKLALPSAAMICLEYWAFELLVLLSGLLPNSEVNTSLIALGVNTQAIAYMIIYGLSAAASTRVSNELGAGNPDRAKNAMVVTLKLSVFLAIVFDLALLFGQNLWISLFTDDIRVKDEYASLVPLIAISVLLDSFQGVLSGVARGCGWQNTAAYVNLAAFYLVGMPVSCLLAFKTSLQARGLWIGLICGLCCQSVSLYVLTRLAKWTRLDLSRDKVEANSAVI